MTTPTLNGRPGRLVGREYLEQLEKHGNGKSQVPDWESEVCQICLLFDWLVYQYESVPLYELACNLMARCNPASSASLILPKGAPRRDGP